MDDEAAMSCDQAQNPSVNRRLPLLAMTSLLVCLGVYSRLMTLAALGCAVLLLLTSPEEELSTLFFLLPFSPVFKLSDGGMSLLTLLVAAFCVVRVVREGRVSAWAGALMALAAFLVINGSMANRGRCVDVLLGAALVLTVYSTDACEVSYDGLLTAFSLGIALSCCFALLSANTGLFPGLVSQTDLSVYDQAEFERFRGLYSNSNYFSADISMALSGLLTLFCMRSKLSAFQWLLACALLCFGVMSASLSFLLTLSVILVFAVMYLFQTTPRYAFLLLLAMLTTAAAVFLLLRGNVYSAMWTRLSDLLGADDASTATTGRSELWKTYAEYLASHLRTLFLGDGLNAPNLGSADRGAHNTFLEALYYLGIVGAGLFTAVLWMPFRARWAGRRRKFYVYLPLLTLLIRAFAVSLLTVNNLYFYVIFSFQALRLAERRPTSRVGSCRRTADG